MKLSMLTALAFATALSACGGYVVVSTPPPRDVIIDSDGDGLSDDEEYVIGTDPYNEDSDFDRLFDLEEIEVTYTDPLYVDSDEDGLSDGTEVLDWYTDPLHWDTDGDGLSDREEVTYYFTDPVNADSDGDGYSDGREIAEGYDPNDFYA
jgi:hypothetical protein